MHLEWLHVANVRNIAELELALYPGVNVFIGPNGAGKTSILEAAYLLSYARSFRAGSNDALVRRGGEAATVVASVAREGGTTRLGLSRSSRGWEARLNHAAVPNLATVLREFVLVCFEPGSHALISGPSQERRSFLDWGVFHVEPDYLSMARRYRRIVQQRNAALKQAASDAEMDVWDVQLAEAAAPLNAKRDAYFTRFSEDLSQLLALFLPELGLARPILSIGWPEAMTLLECLGQNRDRDRARGHTSRGPHRADWSIHFEQAPLREHLSRGQEKLCALACVLAQARHYASVKNDWPVIALDDLTSELDAAHQQVVVDMLTSAGAQVLVTGVEMPEPLRHAEPDRAVFHVEHGQLRALL
ncbi:MAG: DNA replication/repair protein RecF [Rudaea sp.]